jgi:hypothetical protein
MKRRRWSEIRATATPETLARAARRTEALEAALRGSELEPEPENAPGPSTLPQSFWGRVGE